MLLGFGHLELYVSTRANGLYYNSRQAKAFQERSQVYDTLLGKVSSQYLWHYCLSGTDNDAFPIDRQLR